VFAGSHRFSNRTAKNGYRHIWLLALARFGKVIGTCSERIGNTDKSQDVKELFCRREDITFLQNRQAKNE